MTEERSAAMPDNYDRTKGMLTGLPDVTHTRASTIVTTPPLGVGGSETWIVQTYRQAEVGDFILIQRVGADGSLRLVLPPKVAAVIGRQHRAITGKNKSKASKATAEERKAQGIRPAFLKRRTS